MVTENLITLSKTSLSIDEWQQLTDDNRPQCPPCCDIMAVLAGKIRMIRQFDLDGIYAQDLLDAYHDATITHDLSMFPVLLKLVGEAAKLKQFIDEERYEYGYGYGYGY